MGKLSISMAIFNSKLLNYQRVSSLSLWEINLSRSHFQTPNFMISHHSQPYPAHVRFLHVHLSEHGLQSFAKQEILQSFPPQIKENIESIPFVYTFRIVSNKQLKNREKQCNSVTVTHFVLSTIILQLLQLTT